MGQTKHIKGILLLIATAVMWSLGGVFVKSIAINGMAIAGIRSLLAAAVLLLFCRRKCFTFSPTQIAGAFCYCGAVLFYVLANKKTTAANTILLQYTAPIYVAIFSRWFLGEKVSKLQYLAIFAAMCGIVLFFRDDLTFANRLGNIFGIITGLSFGLMILLMRKQKTDLAIGSIVLGNLITALIGVPFIFGSMPDATGWIYLVLLGVVQLGIPYVLYAIAISHVTAIEGVMILTLEPILNPIWVLLVIGERPGKWALAGGLIVICSVTASTLISTYAKRSGSIPAPAHR